MSDKAQTSGKSLSINAFIGLPLSNGGPTYTCEQILASMEDHGANIRLFTPADRRSDIATDLTVHPVVPTLARKVPFSAYSPFASAIIRRRFVSAFRDDREKAIAYLWGDITAQLAERLKQDGVTVVREKFNCAKSYAREIIRAEYGKLDAMDQFPEHQFDEAALAEEARIFAASDAIFCPSPMVAVSLESCGVEEGRLLPTSYGFDPDRLAGDSLALAPIEGATFLFVGYICVRKGAHILLEAWRKAKVSGRLILLGRIEPLIAERYADVLALENVEHHDFTSDVGSYYRSADWFIFPTLEKGGPQVTYEAAFCNLPSLVSRMGAGAIVRDGVEGVIVDSVEVDDWAIAIADAAKMGDQRSAMAETAHQRSLEFTWDKVGLQRLKCIEALG